MFLCGWWWGDTGVGEWWLGVGRVGMHVNGIRLRDSSGLPDV